MRTCRSLVILSLLAAAASAGVVDPAWIRQYSGVTQTQYNQAADSYLDTLTGSLYVVGAGELAANPGGTDLLVAKYRPDGTLAWVNGFSGTGPSPDDMAQAVAVDSDGNVYIAGTANGDGPEFDDAAWAKYDSNGFEIWHRTSTWLGNDVAFGLAIGNAGEVYVCGSDTGTGFLTGYMVARLDPANGDTLWKRSFVLDSNALTRRTPGRDVHPDYFENYDLWENIAVSIAATPDGGVVTTGHGLNGDRDYEWWTMKFNNGGTRAWAAVYHNPNTVYDDDDVAFDVAVARSGDVYVVGFDYYETDANAEGYNYAAVRYSSAGVRLNWRSLNVAAEDGDDYAFSVVLDDSASQNVYVTGSLSFPSPLLDQVSTMKFSSTLASRWGAGGATYGGIGVDQGYSVCYRRDRVYVTGQSDLDLVVLGYSTTNGTGKDTLWSYLYDGPSHLPDFGATICAADSDHVYVSGQVAYTGAPPWNSLYTARLRYGSPDMAVTSILAPQGGYDHYDSLSPRAVVKNYGNVMSRFNAFMYIGLPYGDTVRVTQPPEPGDSVVVTFRVWQADPTGLLPVRCSLEIGSDTVPGNDFLDDTVQVRTLDVGCRLIVSPVGPVESGAFVTPVARFRSYSVEPHTFPVWFRIEAPAGTMAKSLGGLVKKNAAGTRAPFSVNGPLDHWTAGPLLQVYEDSTTITLAGLDSMDVPFDVWEAAPPDTYEMEAFCTLFGDDNPANDTADAQLIVTEVLHDVGVVRITAPADTIDTGYAVIPAALVHNYGNHPETFSVRFDIESFYTDTQTITLGGGADDSVLFREWIADPPGTYVMRCSTMLEGDMEPANDSVMKNVVVLPVGIESPDNLSGIPREYALGSPHPNPFTGRMLVPYALPVRSQVSLRIYDAAGALVRTLTSAELPAGFHHALWNGTDERGRRVQPGTYFCRFQTPSFTRIAKTIVCD